MIFRSRHIVRLRLCLNHITRWHQVLIVLLVAFGPIHLAAQTGDIRGTVTSRESGEKLPFATITVPEARVAASANPAGFFLLAGIPIGTYDVTASIVGYTPKTLRITVRQGTSAQILFELEPRAVAVSEVVITEKRRDRLNTIQTSVQILDQHELRMVPSTVQEDVFRGIQILPGIVSTSDVSSQFYVRGGSSDQNLILLDGMRIYNPYHAYGLFSILDPAIIQATEVYTGAFPAGYGGKLSSVVSLVTRDGHRSSLRASTTVNFLSATMSLEGPIRKDIRGFVSARRSHSTAVWSSFLGTDSPPLNFYDVFAKATLEGNGGTTRLSLTASLSGDDLRFVDPTEPDQSWRNVSIGATASGIIGDRLYITGVASSSSFETSRHSKESREYPTKSRVEDFTTRAGATLYGDNEQTYNFGFEFNFPSFSYKLRNSFGSEIDLHETIVDASLWFRYTKSAVRWSLDGGMHIDLTSLFRSSSSYVFQPRLHGRLALFDDWALKASYGRVTQHAVTVNNEDDLLSLFDAWIAIPSGAKPERAEHVILGIGGSLWSILGVEVQSYYKAFRSLVVYNRDKVVGTDPDYISGTGSAKGVEIMGRVATGRVDVLTSYSLGWVTVTNGDITYPPRYDRRHSLKILTAYHALESMDVSLRWELGSGLPVSPSVAQYFRPTFEDLFRHPRDISPGEPYLAIGAKNSIRLPSFHRLDVAVSYRIDVGPFRLMLGGSIINIYDRKNIFYVDRQSGRIFHTLRFFPSASATLEYQ